ncbi:MAG: hemolysin III family protein [Ferruginibacter sp.]
MKIINLDIIPNVEKWNCITHAFGIIFSIFFIPAMLSDAYLSSNGSQFLNIVLYCIFFLCTFLFSTIYHWLPSSPTKETFRKIDQASIHLLIATSYLPLVYKYMETNKGMVLLILVWAFVPVGIGLIWQYRSKYSPLMITVYLLQGLMFLFFYDSFFSSIPLAIMQMILTGVGFTAVGVLFFLGRKWKYHHALWHLFVLIGNIFFFFAIRATVLNGFIAHP